MAEQRLIDANKIVEVAEHAYHEWNLAMVAADSQREINRVYKMQELCKAVKAVADAAHTVDAVPVVRCEKCKHCLLDLSGREANLCMYKRKSLLNARVKRDDFCSWGERRDDND